MCWTTGTTGRGKGGALFGLALDLSPSFIAPTLGERICSIISRKPLNRSKLLHIHKLQYVHERAQLSDVDQTLPGKDLAMREMPY